MKTKIKLMIIFSFIRKIELESLPGDCVKHVEGRLLLPGYAEKRL